MSGRDTGISLPGYEVGQYFPQTPDLSEDEVREMREEYGWVRTWFKRRPGEHRGIQRWLNQARFGTTYDRYLARAVWYSLAAALAGLLLGTLLALYLQSIGVFAGLSSPVRGEGAVLRFLHENKVVLGAGTFALFTGVASGGAAWLVQYYYPYNVVTTRERSINVQLPHAIVFMYALSSGGMTLLEVFGRLAASDDTYGEVAREFEMVVRDVELFGNDLYTALRNARNITPSEEMERFLDDLVSVLDSGGDTTTFLEEQSDRYLESAMDEQEDFLDTLSILSEVFIVAFVATPVFLIVILMVISFLGGGSVTELALLIYGVLPLGIAAFTFLVSLLSAPYQQEDVELDTGLRDAPTPGALDGATAEEYEAYERSRRWDRVDAILRDPVGAVRDRPALALVVSVPAALAFLAAVLLTGSADPSPAAFLEDPVPTTSRLVVFPLLVALVPLSLFHELKRGRENRIARRFPNTLNILASANQMGIDLVDSLALVSRWSTGTLARELEKLRNDIVWNHDVSAALLAFGNRLRVPQLATTIKLIAEGGKSTGDLSRVMSVAADDTRNQFRIARNRRRAMSSYVAVVVIGFLVYLLIIVLLDTSYLQPISEQVAEAEPVTGPGAPLTLSNVPLETYRMLFFHSVVIQAFGTGLLAGKLTDNRLATGLKYSILLVGIALVVFTLV